MRAQGQHGIVSILKIARTTLGATPGAPRKLVVAGAPSDPIIDEWGDKRQSCSTMPFATFSPGECQGNCQSDASDIHLLDAGSGDDHRPTRKVVDEDRCLAGPRPS